MSALSLSKPGSVSFSATPHRGAWSYIISSSSIEFLTGNIFISDQMAKLPIDSKQVRFSKPNGFIILTVEISGGLPTKANLSFSEKIPEYRTFEGGKSIRSQKTLTAVIAAVGSVPGGYFSENIGASINLCVNHDLMIYANCDGLIFLPAPYSLP